MYELDNRFPGYSFQQHKGYGTKAHLAKLNELGPSPSHRFTFHPVTELCKKQE
jgi:ribonuclease HII